MIIRPLIPSASTVNDDPRVPRRNRRRRRCHHRWLCRCIPPHSILSSSNGGITNGKNRSRVVIGMVVRLCLSRKIRGRRRKNRRGIWRTSAAGEFPCLLCEGHGSVVAVPKGRDRVHGGGGLGGSAAALNAALLGPRHVDAAVPRVVERRAGPGRLPSRLRSCEEEDEREERRAKRGKN